MKVKNFFDYPLSEKKKIINAASKNATKMQLDSLKPKQLVVDCNYHEIKYGTPNIPDWILEYDKVFGDNNELMYYENEVKSFINQTLTQQRTELLTMQQKQNNVAEIKESATNIMNKGGSQGTNKAGETQPLDTAGVHPWREKLRKSFPNGILIAGGGTVGSNYDEIYKGDYQILEEVVGQLLIEQLEMVKEEVVGEDEKINHKNCPLCKENIGRNFLRRDQRQLIDKLLNTVKL